MKIAKDCGTVFFMSVLIKGLKYLVVGMVLALAFSVRSFGADAVEPIEAEGVIAEDTVWSGEVLVHGDVLVPEGVTLTISPGTKVMFAYSESTKIEPMFLSMQTELLVRGVLKVEGKPGNPVSFMPAPEDEDLKAPERGDWGGIIFDGPAASASVVKDANFLMAETAVTTFYSSPAITGCTVADTNYGFLLTGPSSPKLTDCRVSGASYAVVASHGAKPVITGCELDGNEHNVLIKETP